ncbi:MAG: hypothetical protein GJU72_12845 [Acidithiobacillus ferriphilus]|jgi:hypothetical protein|uniref:hypothetical protein n=1 Tax=Acidithiobacillus ferriphilus TaxID=1689834 RepID=UPI00242D9505|nr:hypothetical protein [Acidithiobacillus ferriphilus]MBW9249922.1 hypothetical protein [Acidithiobacillus ferriphilus]MBW9254242.1 hypothetical protein [Acidithiobacillus ferriphilus]
MSKASPNRKPTPSEVNYTTTTTKAGRRGASSLWYAERTLRGKQLTADDVAILSEALSDLREILGGAA